MRGRPGVRHEERGVAEPVLGVHGADCADAEPASLELLPDLRQVLVHDVAEAEHAVLGERQAGMRGHPLDPRLEVLVPLLGYRPRHAVGAHEPAEVRQTAPVDVCVDVVEIDLVELEKQQLLRHGDARF
jgi:hypothetical protein